MNTFVSKCRSIVRSLAALLFVVPVMSPASVIYNWVPDATSSSTGFLEFADQPDPANFTGQPIIGGRFDFDGTGSVFESFDLLSPFTTPIQLTNDFTSSAGVIGLTEPSADLVVRNLDFVLDTLSIRSLGLVVPGSPPGLLVECSTTLPAPFGCGFPGNLNRFHTGVFRLSADANPTAAVPEPSTPVLLGVGIGLSWLIQRRRRGINVRQR